MLTLFVSPCKDLEQFFADCDRLALVTDLLFSLEAGPLLVASSSGDTLTVTYVWNFRVVGRQSEHLLHPETRRRVHQ